MITINLYFKQAWQLMKQNRFFSAVYIIGTGLAISMVMVLAVVYYIRTANIAPEVHRDRMCYLDFVIYKYNEGNGSYSSSLGIRYVKDVVLTLKKPEAIAITTSPIYQYFQGGEMFASVAGNDDEAKISYMGCNDVFWKVYEFHFLYGKPFTESDFESGLKTVVLCRSMARKLFGKEDVIGQTVMLNEVEYRVCGVVEDVSGTLEHTYSQAWMPYTSMSNVITESVEERENTVGKLQANILLRDKHDITAVQAELEEAVKRYNTTLVGGQVTDPKIKPATLTIMGVSSSKAYLAIILFLLLFLLVPALNISGLNASHIQDRLEEIGIRKAFGAPRGTLFMQIFVENLILMFPGSLAGLLFSYGLVDLYKNILLANSYQQFITEDADVITLSAGMLMNWQVFLYAVTVCLLLNLLSSMVPVWNAIRENIVSALNK